MKTFQDGVDGGAPLDTPRRNNSKCFCEKFGQRFPPGRKAFDLYMWHLIK